MTSARSSPLTLLSVWLTSTDATLALLACLTVSTRLSTQSHQVASIRQLQGFLGPRLQTPLLKGQFLATPPLSSQLQAKGEVSHPGQIPAVASPDTTSSSPVRAAAPQQRALNWLLTCSTITYSVVSFKTAWQLQFSWKSPLRGQKRSYTGHNSSSFGLNPRICHCYPLHLAYSINFKGVITCQYCQLLLLLFLQAIWDSMCSLRSQHPI